MSVRRRARVTDVQRALFVSRSAFLAGGGEFVLLEALSALQQQAPDLELHAVFPQDGPLLAAARDGGVAVTVGRVPRWADFGEPRRVRPLVRMLQAIPQAVALLRRLRPDVVVTNTMTIPAHAVAARLLGIPHVWMVQEFGKRDHDLHFLFGHRWSLQLVGALSRRVLCCSRAVEEMVLDAAPAARTEVVYYGVDAPEVPPRPRDPTRPLRAVLVGRYTEAKGVELAIRATATASRSGVDVHLTLVGPGEPETFRQLARDLEVDAQVSFLGATDDVLTHWLAADVALMCSRNEAFGRVTVEAMKAGLPVCGTSSGGTREIVLPDTNGLLVPPGDEQALAACLGRLAADEPLRRRLAEGAYESSRRFTQQAYGTGLCAALGAK